MTTLEQVTAILNNHDGLESNISPFHCYWDLVRQYRSGTDHAELCVFNPAPLNSPKAPPSGTPGQIQAKLALTRNTIRTTLSSFGGRESNIPFTNDYWFLQNVAKSLERELAELVA